MGKAGSQPRAHGSPACYNASRSAGLPGSASSCSSRWASVSLIAPAFHTRVRVWEQASRNRSKLAQQAGKAGLLLLRAGLFEQARLVCMRALGKMHRGRAMAGCSTGGQTRTGHSGCKGAGRAERVASGNLPCTNSTDHCLNHTSRVETQDGCGSIHYLRTSAAPGMLHAICFSMGDTHSFHKPRLMKGQ